MPDQRLVLVVLDAYGVWPILAAIVGPSQKPGHHILGLLRFDEVVPARNWCGCQFVVRTMDDRH
jgi:hypothetical protein